MKLYGVDLNKPISPVMVRDAIIKCFFKAHKQILEQMKEYGDFESDEELTNMEKLNVELLVKKCFSDVTADFDNPTKQDLIKVVNCLREYASHFRNQEIIEKHTKEIGTLINKL